MILLVLISKGAQCMWRVVNIIWSDLVRLVAPSWVRPRYSLFPPARARSEPGWWWWECWVLSHVGTVWPCVCERPRPRAVRGLDSTLSFYRETGQPGWAGQTSLDNTFIFIYTFEWLCKECKVIAIKHFTAYHLGYSPPQSHHTEC